MHGRSGTQLLLYVRFVCGIVICNRKYGTECELSGVIDVNPGQHGDPKEKKKRSRFAPADTNETSTTTQREPLPKTHRWSKTHYIPDWV